MSKILERTFGLHGKVALITGGGTGIGFAIASCLAEAGAKVVLCGRRADVLAQAAAKIGTAASTCLMDLARPDTLAASVESVLAEQGSIDILINNAGNTVKKKFEESTLADLDSVLDVQVRGALELTRQVLPGQLAKGDGSIIFLASMTSFIGMPLVLSYTTAKSAITGMVRGLSAEYASRGIRINAIAPGWIDTELFRLATSGDPERLRKILGRIQMGKVGQPEDIGWAAVYLSSQAGAYVCGQTVVVDGGGAIGF